MKNQCFIPNDRIFRVQDQHQRDVIDSSKDQGKGPIKRMQEGKTVSNSSNPETGIINRQIDSNSISRISCASSFKSSTSGQELWSETSRLERYSETFKRKHSTARVVDTKPSLLEWKKSYSGGSKDNYLHRCVKYRLGCVPGKIDHPRQMDSVGVKTSHQCSGIESNSIRSDVIQGLNESDSTCTDGQHNVRCLHKPSRRHSFSRPVKNGRESLGIMFKTPYKFKGGARRRFIEQSSGSCIKDESEQKRLDVKSDDFQDIEYNLGTLSIGPVCQPNQHSTPSLFLMEARSNGGGNECISSTMVQNEIMGKSSLGYNSENPGEVDSGQSLDDNSGSNVAIGSMVSDVDKSTNRLSDSDPVSRDSQPFVPVTTTPASQSSMETSRMQYFRSRYQDKGFSQKTIDLLSPAVDNRSSRTVSSAIRIWENWCSSQQINPVTCDLNSICEFFSDMFSQGKSYNTIAGYRSAISEIHDFVDNISIGSHPDIIKAMLAMRIDRPPATKTDETINITPSLDYIINLGDNFLMSIKDLTCKTAFLMALVSACRPSDLHRLDAHNCTRSRTAIFFNCIAPKEYNIAIAHSASTSKSRSKTVYIGSYPDEKRLCPYEAISDFLIRTRPWRNSVDQQRALFLITKDPHTPASVDTISNWIKSILRISSPDSTAKDMRVLSAFFAQNAGAGLETVLALGNWSSNSVYHRFYQRGVKLMLERNRISSLIMSEARDSR